MFGDPEACRTQAENCLQQAKETNDSMWLDMARCWISLASDYDSYNPLFDFLKELEKKT